jgi:hypothetical protein
MEPIDIDDLHSSRGTDVFAGNLFGDEVRTNETNIEGASSQYVP